MVDALLARCRRIVGDDRAARIVVFEVDRLAIVEMKKRLHVIRCTATGFEQVSLGHVQAWRLLRTLRDVFGE